MKKSLFALFLCLVLLIGLCPSASYALEEEQPTDLLDESGPGGPDPVGPPEELIAGDEDELPIVFSAEADTTMGRLLSFLTENGIEEGDYYTASELVPYGNHDNQISFSYSPKLGLLCLKNTIQKDDVVIFGNNVGTVAVTCEVVLNVQNPENPVLDRYLSLSGENADYYGSAVSKNFDPQTFNYDVALTFEGSGYAKRMPGIKIPLSSYNKFDESATKMVNTTFKAWNKWLSAMIGGNIKEIGFPNYVVRTAGDVNGDEIVNGKDLIILRRHIAGMSVQFNSVNADMNDDKQVNGKDLILLRRFLAGA